MLLLFVIKVSVAVGRRVIAYFKVSVNFSQKSDKTQRLNDVKDRSVFSIRKNDLKLYIYFGLCVK